MKKTSLILLFFAIPVCLIGQKKYNVEKLPEGLYSGYVITTNNDTINGKIKVPINFCSLYRHVKFIDYNGKDTLYYAKDLRSFNFENSKFISSDAHIFPFKIQDSGPIFIQQMIDGYFKYYRYIKPELSSKGPVSILKLEAYYLYSYGNLQINYVNNFKELIAFIEEHDISFNRMVNADYIRNNLYELFNDYNIWLANSSLLRHKSQVDSVNSLTKLNLEQAFNDSLLFYQSNDNNMNEYMFRILYYAFNTSDYRSYVIYQNRDKYGTIRVQGLKVNLSHGFNKIGTWRYFYENLPDGRIQIMKEESYDFNGKLYNSINYDINGNQVNN